MLGYQSKKRVTDNGIRTGGGWETGNVQQQRRKQRWRERLTCRQWQRVLHSVLLSRAKTINVTCEQTEETKQLQTHTVCLSAVASLRSHWALWLDAEMACHFLLLAPGPDEMKSRAGDSPACSTSACKRAAHPGPEQGICSNHWVRHAILWS